MHRTEQIEIETIAPSADGNSVLTGTHKSLLTLFLARLRRTWNIDRNL
jgi:hypothetical protein